MNWIVQPLPVRSWGLLAPVILGLALSSGAQASPGSAELGATLPPLLDLLERQSPELRAVGHERQAAWERPDVAGALPDPMLTFEEMGIARDDPSLSPSGVGSTRYAFRQTFPIGGKRGLAREIAEAGAEQAAARERLSRVELRSLVKLAFNEYQYAHAAIQVTEELRALVDELESIAQARYRVGLAPQQDVIKAQTEHTSLQSELLTLERDRRGTAARLNGILARLRTRRWRSPPVGLLCLHQCRPWLSCRLVSSVAILNWLSSMHEFKRPSVLRRLPAETGFRISPSALPSSRWVTGPKSSS